MDYDESIKKAEAIITELEQAQAIGMDEYNRRNMIRICGGDRSGKISLLLDYTDRPGSVADPWYTGDFLSTWRDVDEGCRGLLRYLEEQGRLCK